MSLANMGIEAFDIQNALDLAKIGKLGTHTTPAQTTYVLCPIDHTLWDLKPIIGTLFDSKNIEIPPSKWVTNTYERGLLEFGFTIIKFSIRQYRTLGIHGFNGSELEDDHIVYWPPNGRKKINGFATKEPLSEHGSKGRKKTTTNRFIRNSAFVQNIRNAADGICGACGNRAFQKPSGEWFLEVHHKNWLREDGSDVEANMIALCPNCHRQEHHGTNRLFW